MVEKKMKLQYVIGKLINQTLNLGKKIRAEVVSKHLNIPLDKVNFIDHASGHAAYAYFSKKIA